MGTNRVGNPRMGAAYVQFLVNADYWVRRSVTAMIFSGVFDRFPGLKVVSVEHELGWLPHFFVTFQEDAPGIETRDIIGADNIMWSSDYPHKESSWPESQKILRKILAGVPEAEQRRMTTSSFNIVYRPTARWLRTPWYPVW